MGCEGFVTRSASALRPRWLKPLTKPLFGMRFAPIFPELKTTKSTKPEVCHVGVLHACRIHGRFTALASAGHAGWAQGRTAAGTQWRRAAGDLVRFVDRRSLARYSSCHGVFGTNCAPEVATVAGKGRLGSVTYETAGPSQP